MANFGHRVIPLLFLARWHRLKLGSQSQLLRIERGDDHKSVILSITGAAIAQNVGLALPHFRKAAAAGKQVVINFAGTCLIDARFLGLLLMLNKWLKRQGLRLSFTEISPRIARFIRFSGFGFFLRI
jgi:N-acetylglucosaminyldiphosphoundecaprenol N-acetyl-beta-D-mannosaminyltransferase